MAAVSMAPGLFHSRSHQNIHPLTTLPDPRSARPSPAHSRTPSVSPPQHHPDLTDEVASLSNKLIAAINHQTNLDDTLTDTRHELDAERERVRQLEAQIQKHDNLVADGVLVNRKDLEDNTMKLMADLAGERKKRSAVEKEKKSIEIELETLTTALFEEANEMVSAARKERENAEKRNEQLRSQLNDTELLLASHQEQLAELKSVMQSITSDKAESEAIASTTPSTPAMQHQENMNRVFEQLHISTDVPCEDIPPAPPTSFTHLLSPVLRTDLVAYDDFHTLLETSRKSAPSSRVTSGSYGTLNLAALANAHRDQIHILSNGSTSSLSTATTWPKSSPGTPSTAPTSANSSVSSRDLPVSNTSLKETRFYKRALTEDIEPTLRLDLAPGLSWLARRAVINSMCEGSLVVEPTPAVATLHHQACSLCGECRKGPEYNRTHRFRTSENENAQRHPLCDYCLNRLRSTCDFLGFLRMIKDGHWRTEGEQAEAVAWEESVRLRERMFWARVGGGVIPTFARARDSPRPSVEERPAEVPRESNVITDADHSTQETPSEDPFYVNRDRTSVYSNIEPQQADGLGIEDASSQLNPPPPAADVPPSPAMPEDEATRQLHANLNAYLEQDSKANAAEDPSQPQEAPYHPRAATPPQPQTSNQDRQSITMPGGFDF